MFSFDQAFSQIANRTSLAELTDLVRNTSAKLEGAASNVTSLLYSGVVNGDSSILISKELADKTTGASGADRLVRVRILGSGLLI